MILYSGVPGDSQIVYNGTTADLRVYPHSGGNINQLAADAGFVLARATAAKCYLINSTQWIAFLSA